MSNFTINITSICKDSFWDSDLTWYSANPDFPECFQKVILVILPCCIFSIVSIVNLSINWKQRTIIHLPWSFLNIMKLVLCVILLSASTVELGLMSHQKHMDMTTPDVNLYAAAIKFITYTLIIMLMLQNRLVGIRSSTLLTLFWLVTTICSIILLRSTVLRAFYHQHSGLQDYQYIPDLVYYPIVFCQFLLSIFVDKAAGIALEEKSPFETSSFYSFLTFHWFNSLIVKSRNNLLMVEDFPPLPTKMDAKYLWNKFEVSWNKELQNHKKKVANGKSNSTPRLGWTVVKSLWPWIVAASIFQVIHNFSVFLSPLLLDQLLLFMAGGELAWKGYFFGVLMFISEVLSYSAFNFMMYYSECFALQLQTTVSSAVYRKSLKLSSSSRREYTTGEIVNLVSVDVDKVYQFTTFSTFTFGAPIKIILTITFLWMYLGASCLSGVVVLILMIFLSGVVSKRVNTLQERQMETKDSRLKFMTEILNGIKVLKLYAWEIPFIKKITDIRLNEVYLIRSFQLFYAVFSFVWGSASFMVAVTSFITFILVNKNNVLTPNIVFVSLNLLNILRYAVLEIPELTTDSVQTLVSVRRIATFLASEEHQMDLIGNTPDEDEAISIRNASFGWDAKEEPTLKDIDFHVPKGKLVAVIGPVGSGKSSLLSLILGEMYKMSGSVDVKGKIAYVPQQAWVLNQTVKENILFVKPLNSNKYNNILESCSLKSDLDILPAGDKTEIGEKGVNLSGGQKQRVSLARAVYHNADVYLLDDPLSAVDAHVGKHIFDHVIGKTGLLKNKSRVLVTHNISVLSEADLIITMKDGKIEESGSYDELMHQQGLFSELIKEFSNIKEPSNEDELTDLETVSKGNPRLPVRRSISVQSVERTISTDSKLPDDPMGRLTEDEKMEVGEVKRTTLITYAKHMSLKIIVLACFGYMGNQCFDIGANVWLSEWSTDKPNLNGSYDIALRNERIGVYAALGTAQSIFMVFGSISIALGASRAAKLFHRKLLESVMRAPMSFFDTTPLGRILNRFGRDIEDIDQGIPGQLDAVCYCVFASIGTIALIGSKLPLFLPFLIPLAALFYIIQKIYLVTSRQLKRISSTTRSPVYSHFTESIQGASSINAFKVVDTFIEKVETKINSNCSSKFMWNSCTRWLDIRLAIMGNIIILLTAVLGVSSRDQLPTQIVGLTLTYALSVTDILTFLIRCFTDLENKYVAVERVVEYSSLESEAPWEIPESQPPDEWPEWGKVKLLNYSTKYRENLDLVLKDVNLEIAESEKVGIVGRTGAGKSSITLSLFRIIEPVTGTINIDNIDISKIGLHKLRSKLTIIPQDPVLFTGPLRINLDPNDDYSDDEVWSSLEHSNLKTFVSSLPEGLAYEVAEGGSNLSVGQRQLICLARALLKKTKILILDEATAAVDVETDRLIQNTIKTEFKNHTVITIAHRLNTIMDYDKIIVMDAGAIAEEGNPSDLLQNSNSRFYKMAKDAGLV